MIKRLYLLPLLLITALPLSAQDVNLRCVEQAVEQARLEREGQCALYAPIRARLEAYYGRSDFADPSRQTGWYRVQSFLEWLRRAEPVLTRERVNAYTGTEPVCSLLEEGQTHQLGAYLGARYLADQLKLEKGLDQISFFPHSTYSASMFDSASILLPYEQVMNLPQEINLGIHELTHLLPVFFPNKPQRSLSESATFVNQSAWGLPVRGKGELCFSQGVRHLPSTLAAAPAQCHPLREYNAVLAGTVSGVQDADLFALPRGEAGERTVESVLHHLWLLRHKKLQFKRAGSAAYVPSEKEYLQTLVPPVWQTPKLYAFYADLAGRLAKINFEAAPLILPLPQPNAGDEGGIDSLIEQRNAMQAFIGAHEKEAMQALAEAFSHAKLAPLPLPPGYI